MTELSFDPKGFTCECGTRNDYPAYVQDHWSVRLFYSCACLRQYVLYRGTVRKVTREIPEYHESDAFGD